MLCLRRILDALRPTCFHAWITCHHDRASSVCQNHNNFIAARSTKVHFPCIPQTASTHGSTAAVQLTQAMIFSALGYISYFLASPKPLAYSLVFHVSSRHFIIWEYLTDQILTFLILSNNIMLLQSQPAEHVEFAPSPSPSIHPEK